MPAEPHRGSSASCASPSKVGPSRSSSPLPAAGCASKQPRSKELTDSGSDVPPCESGEVALMASLLVGPSAALVLRAERPASTIQILQFLFRLRTQARARTQRQFGAECTHEQDAGRNSTRAPHAQGAGAIRALNTLDARRELVQSSATLARAARDSSAKLARIRASPAAPAPHLRSAVRARTRGRSVTRNAKL